MLYDMIYTKQEWDYPVRGHDQAGKYHAFADHGIVWANYWCPTLKNHPKIASIKSVTDKLVAPLLSDPVFYDSTCSVIRPGTTTARVHIDTPHRHAPWATNTHRLAIQFAIPLHDGSAQNGATAFLPGSHNIMWDIEKCYSGEFNDHFRQNAVQPEARFGDIVMWDSRTLHSQMPNLSHSNRYMVLLNYVERDILADLQSFEFKSAS
jgi:ectoine hydroxylase-related dioxygenase (phytanoyl-CoA dioxygenase family)